MTVYLIEAKGLSEQEVTKLFCDGYGWDDVMVAVYTDKEVADSALKKLGDRFRIYELKVSLNQEAS